MTLAAAPFLKPGMAYRTRDLAAWSANPPRLAKRLVRDGQLVPLAHGLFLHPTPSRFGPAPASDQELMRVFLDGTPFVFTGPERWNALGLGSTALFAHPLVYNTKRSGLFRLGGRSFQLRRVAFPPAPSREWFAVDLLEHADQAGTSRVELAAALGRSLASGAFSPGVLAKMVKSYGSKAIQALVQPFLEKVS
ncbi:MAG: hypothetical protein ACREKE_10375 [bacterium]